MGLDSINIGSHLPQYEHKHVFCVKEWIAYMTHQHQFVIVQHTKFHWQNLHFFVKINKIVQTETNFEQLLDTFM